LGLLGSSGGEGGVHGFQPAEFAKGVMALLLAMVMVTREDLRLNFTQTQGRLADYRVRHFWQSPTGWVTLRLFFWALLLVLLAGIVLGSVRDFSPVLILMLLAFGFAWAIRSSLPKLMQGVVVLSPLAILVLLWLAWHNVGWFAAVLEHFQGDRLLVWVNPWSDPDSGLQAIRSLEAINGAGWFGQSWFGENGDLMKVPAVQNDFILAFVLGRTGAIAGLVLLVMQLCWVGLLFGLHQRLLAVRGNGRNGTLAVQLLAWLLYGLAWLQITHWLISWCNVLGLLPIMGQPMTWISSGNSHLLALGLPTLLLALLAARYLQYKDAA
jgi:cell division protein FtsW (lipid II flippase)